MENNLRSFTIPVVAEIKRIASLQDPVLRNLLITQSYYELSRRLAQRTGMRANWCTFATWASKQAGQSIRKDDLARLLEERLLLSEDVEAAIQHLSAISKNLGSPRSLPEIRQIILQVLNLSSAVEKTSQAVARGNLKVFAEIGQEFARFCEDCAENEIQVTEKITGFCEALCPGDPPDGQDYLRRAFANIYQSLFEPDPKTAAELTLLANIEIGYHEQTRLQPEILEAMDAPLVDTELFLSRLLSRIFPRTSSVLVYARVLIMKLLGRPPLFELAVRRLLSEVQMRAEELITELLMSITFPDGIYLSLAHDLAGQYPSDLQTISNLELCELLERVDPTLNSLLESGTVNWSNLPDRIHFIVDLFRLYQESELLFGSPFTPDQEAVLKEGRLPDGNL